MDLIEDDEDTLELSRLSGDGRRPMKWLPTGRIKFDKVAYTQGANALRPVIQNCSFEIQAGQTLAIAGITGVSTKSTLLDLIMRFYDISDGRILIDGKNIRDADITEVRGNMAYVPRNPDLFRGTISDNILYGYRGAKAEDFDMKSLVDGVIHQVGLNAFVLNLPNSYQTIVDDDCPGMSELVKWKIMFARALIRNPKVLLIDEPTGYFYGRDESEMVDLLQSAKVGRTCIFTTTNRNTIKTADLVGMFGHDNFTQFGTKEELATAGDENTDYRKFTTVSQPEPPPPTDSALDDPNTNTGTFDTSGGENITITNTPTDDSKTVTVNIPQ